MKTKILSLVLVLALLVGAMAVLSSCGECKHENFGAWARADADNHQRVCLDCGEYTETAKHNFKPDANYDELAEEIPVTCSVCSARSSIENTADRLMLEFESKIYPWMTEGTTELVMSICDNSNKQELESGGMAYVSGEWTKTAARPGETVAAVDSSILSQIIDRNAASEAGTGVHLTYKYMEDKGWGAVKPQIVTEYGADGTPDIYYSLIYDMVGASIEGMFANILGNEYLAPFYQTFEGDATSKEVQYGYNWEYMNDLSFSTKAMYLIASDYSFDISRAYFVQPVNLALLATAKDVTGDVDGDGEEGTEEDFFMMIDDGEWTWAKIGAYTEKVRKEDSLSGGYALSGNSVAGFAMSTSSGLSTTPALYASNIEVVKRTIGQDGEYSYYYDPATPQSLIDAFTVMDQYVIGPAHSSQGVILYGGETSKEIDLFVNNRLFVNASCVLGAIEQTAYQSMWDTDKGGMGFAVAPVAKISAEQEDYRTLVHNIGKVFGISAKCKAVDAAVAFINYQTLYSSDILEEYYTWSVGYGQAVTDANVAILLSMGDRLRYGIDKVVDDALGLQYTDDTVIDPTGNGTATMKFGDARWHTFMIRCFRDNMNGAASIVRLYEGVYEKKLDYITEIQNKFVTNIDEAE